MKTSLRLSIAALSVAAASAPVRAQDLGQDTLAVRILLDQNGLTSTPVAQVAGIDAASARVTSLRLRGLGLVSLPPHIGSLDALRYLVLSDNLLDSLPAGLWDLTRLVELDLGGNRIGRIDPRVGRLQSLLFLGLRGNGLGSLPDSLFGLPNLETLLLAGNSLDTLPEAVGGLAFLKYLDLSGNRLRALPYTVAALETLDSLDVSGNALESLPASIVLMPSSTRVRLGDNRLCHLEGEQADWADAKDPDWSRSQACGSGLRRSAPRSRGRALRAWSRGGRLRLDWSGTGAGEAELALIVRDVSGRELFRGPVRPGETGISLALAGKGFLWAELRAGGRTLGLAGVPGL